MLSFVAQSRTKLSIALACVCIARGGGPNVPAVAFAKGDAAGLMALYSFDSRSGSVLRDLSGNGIDGTVYGATWVDGRFGQALRFDGVDDYVQAVGQYRFSAFNALTVEAWVKLTGHSAFDNILSFRNCCAYRLLISPSLHPYFNPGTNTDVEVGAYTLALERWYHIALVSIGGGVATVFVDGDRVFAGSNGVPEVLPDMFEALYIGGSSEGQGIFTEGLIDEVRIYNKALTEGQIRASLLSSSTEVLTTHADSLLEQLGELGLAVTAVRDQMRQAKRAVDRRDDQLAQNLLLQAGSAAKAELEKHEIKSRGLPVDYGKVLYMIMGLVSLVGLVTAGAFVLAAWNGERSQ
jgi:Concanavalin A-like lectin/glucanases superfamily